MSSSALSIMSQDLTQGAELMVEAGWGYVFAAMLGALLGSFLNVVRVRLPRGLSIVSPGSHCMTCEAPIKFYDNIPVISYILLRGRCRRCKASFSPSYLFLELMVAALSVAVFHHTVLGKDVWIGLALFFSEILFCCVLVAVAFIDLRTWIIPDVITYPATLVFLAVSILLHRLLWWEALAGAASGIGLLGGTIWIYHRITGREGMGWGDAKLLMAIGAFLGVKQLPAVVFFGAVQGLLAAVLCLLTRKTLQPQEPYVGITDVPDEPATNVDETDPTEHAEAGMPIRHIPIPFGPFLALAAIEMLFWGDSIIRIWIPS